MSINTKTYKCDDFSLIKGTDKEKHLEVMQETKKAMSEYTDSVGNYEENCIKKEENICRHCRQNKTGLIITKNDNTIVNFCADCLANILLSASEMLKIKQNIEEKLFDSKEKEALNETEKLINDFNLKKHYKKQGASKSYDNRQNDEDIVNKLGIRITHNKLNEKKCVCSMQTLMSEGCQCNKNK